MSELRTIADSLEGLLKSKGIEKYQYTLSQSEKQELNLENGQFKLMRTVFNNTSGLSIFRGTKYGAVSGNDITPEGLEKLVDDGISAADSADEDPCHDIAPDQGKKEFRQGVYEPDLDKFIERIKELLATVEKEYPLVQVMSANASFDRWNSIKRNSNGSEFETFAGHYTFILEFSGHEGEKTTGLDYTFFVAKDLDRPFIEIGEVRRKLDAVQKSLNAKPMEGKFEGTIVLTPEMSAQFVGMALQNFASSGVIIDGTGLWLNKVGEQVASEKLTVELKPYDERLVMGERVTGSGFISEDATLIDKGTLKTHMLNLYAANKTGRPMLKNTSFDLVIEPGDVSVEELIASVDKGLLVGGFSGGNPGGNGEFSGVAKNSFLIENGKITDAVTETMINGNLNDALKNITAISKELVCDGNSVVPYIAVKGIVVSGK